MMLLMMGFMLQISQENKIEEIVSYLIYLWVDWI